MKFNKIWNKHRQQKLQQMNKEGKSVDEIRDYFGSLLQYHPNKIYCSESFIISKFKEFNNESVINKFNEIEYTFEKNYSMFYNFKNDYIAYFKINNIEYVLILFYLIDGDDISYNIVFSTKVQYDKYIELLENFLEKNEIEDIDEDLYFNLSNILEKETKINNADILINAVSYVLIDIYNKLLSKKTLFSIGQTKNNRKINWYRHIIKYSFDNVIEIEKIDSIGNKIYYYDLKNIKLKNRNNNKLI